MYIGFKFYIIMHVVIVMLPTLHRALRQFSFMNHEKVAHNPMPTPDINDVETTVLYIFHIARHLQVIHMKTSSRLLETN